jgi:PAS domain-containing protein
MAKDDSFELLVILRQVTSAADQACVGITRCSSDLRYTFVNRFFAQSVGKSPGEVEGKLIAETVGAEVFAIISPYLARALSGDVVDFESRITCHTGDERFVHFKYVPDFDDSGAVIGLFSTEIDVTGYRQRK